jgi:DNA polymerase V
MGMPFFKAKPIIDKNDVTWFSSNYALYGDMSRRVMNTIEGFVSALEHYSIDEAFVHLDQNGAEADAHQIRNTVKKWTGIPVSVGIDSTKVLAKIANAIAKKNPKFGGVVDLSGVDADKYLKEFDVADVWGIGRKYAQFLKAGDEGDDPQPDLWEASGFGRLREKPKIETAYDLKNCDDDWIRKHLTVKDLRLVWELRGISCFPLELFEKPKRGCVVLARSDKVSKKSTIYAKRWRRTRPAPGKSCAAKIWRLRTSRFLSRLLNSGTIRNRSIQTRRAGEC